MAGVLYVNKPKGITSFDVCYKLRKVLKTKKIGHTGTLDPGASGVMIVLYDKATKANQFLVSDCKEYIAEVLTGVVTDTLDMDGTVVQRFEESLPERETIEETLRSFLGKSSQEVPMTSAVSVDGKRLYRYQREGKEVVLPVREIEVFDISLQSVSTDSFVFSCVVSSGTYIRSLARDIMRKMGIHGVIKQLCRTAIDDVRIKDCDDLESILNGRFHEHDLYDVLSLRYPVFEDFDEKDVRNGKKLSIASDAPKVLLAKGHEVFAIYERQENDYRCVRGLW